MQVILELAFGSAGEERSPHFAIIYDDLLRKELEIQCGQMGDKSRITQLMLEVVPFIERRAVRCAI